MQTKSQAATSAYSFGFYDEGDREIVLVVRPLAVTLEQFDADIPRLVDRLRREIATTQAEVPHE